MEPNSQYFQKIIDILINNSSVELKLKLSHLNTTYRSLLLNDISVKELINCFNCLYYNENTYDSLSYERDILRKTIKDNYYFKLPTLSYCTSDFDDDNVKLTLLNYVYFDFHRIPLIYKKYPYPRITIFSRLFIQNILYKHANIICKHIAENNFSQLILFVPLFYQIHYETKWDEDKYTLVMCYCNIIDDSLSDVIFTNDKNANELMKNSYVYLKFNDHLSEDKINEKLLEKTQNLIGNDYSKLREINFLRASECLKCFE